jgi:hypothetical protein
MKQKFESVKLETEKVNQVRKIVEKTKQSISGFIGLAIAEYISKLKK